MTNGSKRWQISSPITPQAEAELSGYPPILRQILFNRGYPTLESARIFLEGQKPPGTNPKFLLGIEQTVERILKAVDEKENIAIYGDYDCDGVTATAVLRRFLELLGVHVISYIPNRFQEGYGLKKPAIKYLKGIGVDLIITVDCGIRSIDEANYADQLGLDLIITDHHHPGEELPEAIAVIDPKQDGDQYPEKELAGVGIAYKIIEAISAQIDNVEVNPEEFLDLVALGTVADLAPLVGENRYLVKEGLKHIRNPNRQGLMSLIGVSGLNRNRINSNDIGFGLGPRINAAGRLDSADLALELLLADDVSRAGYLAQKLESLNSKRQQITKVIQKQAEELVLEKDPDALILFAVHKDFNLGVVGLAASRLLDRFYRPAVIGHLGEKFTRASCRSITEFHITKALDQCSDLLEYYGGHAAAAGFTVENKNLEELSDRLNLIAEEQLSEVDIRPTIIADIEIPLSKIDPRTTEHLEWLQPTGYGNPNAVFVSRNLRVQNRRAVGKDKSHLKLTVSDDWITYDAIAFRQAYWIENLPKYIDLIYNLEINEYNGRETVQLNVLDIKPSGMVTEK